MRELQLAEVEGYDRETQRSVALLAACLDDQLRRLRREVEGLELPHLEWQERPGRNTIGMLLTHLAAVEIGWLLVVAQGLSWENDAAGIIRGVIGVEDDGFPLPGDGGHPACLRGLKLGDYLSMLDRARERSHEMLRTWTDADLETTYAAGDRVISRGWTLYHLLEHFAAHFGQILLVMHHLRDAGLLEQKQPS